VRQLLAAEMAVAKIIPHSAGEPSVRTDSPLERRGLELAVPRRICSRERTPRVGALFGPLSWNESAENIARLRSVGEFSSVGSPSRKLTVAPIARDGSPEFGFHCVTLPV
jgi:hypothetical protein